MLPTYNIVICGDNSNKIHIEKLDKFIIDHSLQCATNVNTNEGIITINPIFVNSYEDIANLKYIDGVIIIEESKDYDDACKEITDNIVYCRVKSKYFDNPFIRLMNKIKPSIQLISVREKEFSHEKRQISPPRTIRYPNYYNRDADDNFRHYDRRNMMLLNESRKAIRSDDSHKVNHLNNHNKNCLAKSLIC